MIYSLQGFLALKSSDFFVVNVGGVGFKVFSGKTMISSLPAVGDEVRIFCRVYVRDDEIEMYGFLSERDLEVFELLNSVGGVGPRSALSVMNVAKPSELLSVIKENRADILSMASGVGKKTAERITLELKDKVQAISSSEVVKKMEDDSDIIETLVGLGYKREYVKKALLDVSDEVVGLEKRLKEVLRVLSSKK